ncbi:PP2C family protein-serine/threonine phosphatase [Spirosoma montaniterrae]|uniref:Serine/threonine protein phosphatase n=1 Tax=Spirosoma montaniterrae TaxID=1178516 RepID=A0A1P9X3H6_9BACT|nr:protein phosphatase 2C domain-containing protein [Spirosoma montaniterrae]AQG82157.1 serine/threonine protein phosphatase [Spirosoma montaniterrae]
MRIHLTLPLAFSQVGQRNNNQDALYPPVGEAQPENQLFLVCDGMGGADKGEVASQLLCQHIVAYAQLFDFPTLDSVHLQTALSQAYEAYRQYLLQHPLVNRMGSTLALVQVHERGITVAHIGDSRVYQIRDGRIIFQTRDHKQVNDMVEAGIITATQALTHPWRNRLSRAVVATAGEVDVSARATPDITLLTDVRAGDYFFLCTDGVLEQLHDELIEALFVHTIPNQAKLQSLLALCEGQVQDNYSGYLFGIEYVAYPETYPTPLPYTCHAT